MSTYEDDHNLPRSSEVIPGHESQPRATASNTTTTVSTNPNPESDETVNQNGDEYANGNEAHSSPYIARPAPETFDAFLREVDRVREAAAGGGGGIMLDEDLYEEVFGDQMRGNGSGLGMDGLLGSKGASKEFIDGLSRVLEEDLLSGSNKQSETGAKGASSSATDTNNNLYTSSCPICLSSYASILTEEEYAHASDFHVGGEIEDMGLRRLPCGRGGDLSQQGQGHVVCGNCARRWLKLNNTCPLCRSIMDPDVPPPNPPMQDPTVASAITSGNYNDSMLALFRAVFGHEQNSGRDAGLEREEHGGTEEREEFGGMYS